jgi:hypothetical protein
MPVPNPREGRGFESRPDRLSQPLKMSFFKGFLLYTMPYQVYILQSLSDGPFNSNFSGGDIVL